MTPATGVSSRGANSDSVGTWLGVALGAVGLLVSLGGFAFTIVQVRKTRSAAEAARDAVGRAQHDLARTRLLALIPNMLRAEASLAAATESAAQVATLVEWRHLAGEVQGIANSEATAAVATRDEFDELVQALTDAMSLAIAAETAARSSGGGRAAFGRAMGAIARASVSLSILNSRLQAYTEGDEHRG